VADAAVAAVSGDVVLLAPACSSFDQFDNYEHRGQVFRQLVSELS
jgi:UDP-N-acetylmuramoylalanine--D-glutamate ligase